MRISHGSEFAFSLLCDAYNNNNNIIIIIIIITSMPMVAMDRIQVKRIILFAKIVTRYFESKEWFWVALVPKF